jgi:hypothetical protein
MSTTQTVESGVLPGRIEFVREPSYFGVPTDPSWKRFSDVARSFTAGPGPSYSAQADIGTPDAADHFRGLEDPSCEVTYDLQKQLVDGSGNPDDAAADGILRDSENQLQNTHMVVHRREHAGGNDNAGIREYTVMRGGKIESVDAENAPDDEQPIGVTLSYAPRKVRSFLIHQPSSGTTLDVSSTSSNDTMDLTVEDEGAATSETITLSGTTTASGATTFSDIDAAWLSAQPEGDVTVTDGSGTTLMIIKGGTSYSDDGQPVDGDRGVPPLGSGSHASAIGTSFEHFVGDRLERPSGSAVRQRVSTASWSIENDLESNPVHDSRYPVYDEGNRTVSVDTDVAGKTVSHDNFVEALTKDQQNLEHELDSTLVTFKNTVPADIDAREVDAESGVSVYSVTFEASGDPAITLAQP